MGTHSAHVRGLFLFKTSCKVHKFRSVSGHVVCAGAPDCEALNRHPCADVTNTCGQCFERHIGTVGYSNDLCFGAFTTNT